jgi:hypothetical protein
VSLPERDRARADLLARIADPGLGRTPLQLPSVRAPSGLPRSPSVPGSVPVRTDAERRFERVAIPATVLAGFSLLLCAVVGVAMLIGWSGAFPLVLLILSAVGFIGFGAMAVRAGAVARRETRSTPAVLWQSSQAWLGPLAAGPERRLVTIACDAVSGITGSAAWGSAALDDHRLTLDLTAELDQIDAQAYALAFARYTGTGSVTDSWPGAVGAGPPSPARAPGSPDQPPGSPDRPPGSPDQWMSLIDHVAALEGYAAAVAAAGSSANIGPSLGPALDRAPGLGARGPGGTPQSPELQQARDQQLAAGAVRDEFSTAHLVQLTAELKSRAGQ